MLGEPKPNEADPNGERYAFEKRGHQDAGGDGCADVWKKGFFAWEYKGKRKDLRRPTQQLLRYRRGAREPAAAGRLRPRTVRDPHQLDRTPSKRCTGSASRSCAEAPITATCSRRSSASPTAEARADPAGANREAAGQFAGMACGCASAATTTSRGALPQPARLLHVRRGRRACCRQGVQRNDRRGREAAGTFSADGLGNFRRDADRRAGRLRGGAWFNGGLFDGDDAAVDGAGGDRAGARAASSMGGGRARDLRHAVRARPRPGQAIAARRALHRPRQRSCVSSSPWSMGPLAASGRTRSGPSWKRRMAEAARRGPAQPAATIPRRCFHGLPRAAAGDRVLDPACGSGNFLYVALLSAEGAGEAKSISTGRAERSCAVLPGVGPQAVSGSEINDVRGRTGAGGRLDRRDSMDGGATGSRSRGPDPRAAGDHPTARTRCSTGAIRDRREAGVAAGGRHHRQPAVPRWREADAAGLGDGYVADLFGVTTGEWRATPIWSATSSRRREPWSRRAGSR